MGVDYVSTISKLNTDLAGHFNEDIDVTTNAVFLKFMAQGVSKGNAVTDLSKKLDIALSEVVHSEIVQTIFLCCKWSVMLLLWAMPMTR